MEKRASLAIFQLIHRLMQADISCTTTACLVSFPLLINVTHLLVAAVDGYGVGV